MEHNEVTVAIFLKKKQIAVLQCLVRQFVKDKTLKVLSPFHKHEFFLEYNQKEDVYESYIESIRFVAQIDGTSIRDSGRFTAVFARPKDESVVFDS